MVTSLQLGDPMTQKVEAICLADKGVEATRNDADENTVNLYMTDFVSLKKVRAMDNGESSFRQ